MADTNRAKVFIGSSTEAKKYTKRANDILGNHFEVIPWYDPSVHSVHNKSVLDSLIKQSYLVDFAIFIITADDLVYSRARKFLAPRHNVLFEFGIYLQSLGKERCFLVVDKQAEILSDMDGISLLQFDASHGVDSIAQPVEHLSEDMQKKKKHIPSLVTTGLAYGYYDMFVKPLASWHRCSSLTVQLQKRKFDGSQYQQYTQQALIGLPVRAAYAERSNNKQFVDYPTTLNVIQRITTDKSELSEEDKDAYRNREVDNFKLVLERLMDDEPFCDKVVLLD